MRLETLYLLRCPACKRGSLHASELAGTLVLRGDLICNVCSRSFPVDGGIPVFLPEIVLVRSTDDKFDYLDAAIRQKVLQREWHDRAHMDGSGEYKTSTYSKRSFFAFLLYYQLREIESLLASRRYSVIANICCGHGFELEYLSLFGNNVIAADISLKSVQRAVAEGQRLGISVDGICCDAENLPLNSDTCDLVIAHHSLHHLADPVTGMEEMVRVSRGRTAFCEPAKGIMRQMIRAVGLKPTVEESGNNVYEFGYKEVKQWCQRQGVQLRCFEKSLVTGPTREPVVFKRLDEKRITPLLCFGITAVNRALGQWIGTKCSVVIDKPEAALLGAGSRRLARA